MWTPLFLSAARKLLRSGDLTITFADGRSARLGDGTGQPLHLHFTTPDLPRQMLLRPELTLGEGYMNGTLKIAPQQLRPVLQLLAQETRKYGNGRFKAAAAGARPGLRRLMQHNPLKTARRNVEHHYDLSVDLYRLFLDTDLQYTCAYYPQPDLTLEQAQAAKKAHIAQKLMLQPGQRVLDIGCGWGGTALTLARDFDVEVVGVSLSQVQIDHARARAKAEGLSHRIDYRLCDYRDVAEQFDRITVVGMLEHVGQPQYARFFDTLHNALAPDGIALIHTIGRATPPGKTSPFIHKYIFPGGYAPALSELSTSIERAGLTLCDLEVWRSHYITTLRAWQDRFEANLDAIRALYDDQFCRMWRYYLTAAEVGFSDLGMQIFQMQLAHCPTIVPDNRQYLYPPQTAPQPPRHITPPG